MKLLTLLIISVFSISLVSAFDFPHTIVNIDYTGNLTNLSEMQDVNIPSPSNEQLLQFNSGTNKWVAATLSGTTDTNASTACTGTDYLAGNGSCLSAVGGGAGDITSVNTNGKYLTGGNTSGDVNLLLNESELNTTIDSRDSDTTYTNGTGLNLVGDTFSIVLSYFQGLFLELNGGTMTGDLNMGNNNILNVNTINITNNTYVDYLRSSNGNSIYVLPSGDEDDSFSFKTVADRPTIKREGGKYVYFESSNAYDMGISFRDDDTYSGTVNYEKDNHVMTVLGKNSPLGFKANSEYFNYILFETYDHQPQISVFNGTTLLINDSLEVNGIVNATGKIYSEGIEVLTSLSDTNASTACSGSTTYLDGEGNCDDISSVYAPLNYGDDWNKTYADTLYADIGVTGDDTSWNKTYADTLYADISLVDTNTHVTADGDYLSNDSTTIYFDETKLNATIDARDTDTTYTNGTGISLVGNVFSLIGDFFSGSWNDLTDVPSGFADGIDNDTGSDLTHLTNFTDDLGDRGYTHLTNFTDDLGFISNNDSWNETYADTLYADISVTDTNETTRFNTLVGTDCGAGNYSYGFDANGLIQCREDEETIYSHLTNFTDDLGNRGYTSNLNFTNDAGYYNSSDFSISDYYTKANIDGFNYWNDTYATFNKTYADTLYADISVTGDNSSWNESYADTLYRADSWDNFTGIPTATPSNGDTTHLSLAGEIYDFVIGLGYATTTYVDNLVASVGNWSADKSDYWNTSSDLDTVISDDEISESKIEFTTLCGAGNHYYLNGNDLACEVDSDTIFNSTNVAWINESNTFTENQIMNNNLTVDMIVFEDDAIHNIESNSTCIIIQGDTSKMYIC